MNTAAMFLFIVVDAGSAANGNRIVNFAEGSTSVQTKDGVDHVVVRDLKGKVTFESRCYVGTFSEYFALFTTFKDAVSRGDREATLSLIHYPFRVNGEKRLTFRNASALTPNYDKVFTSELQNKIRTAEPAAVLCRDGLATVGDGLVWAKGPGVAILNP